MASRRSAGWVPQQHGAWAMLFGPYLAGLVLRAEDRTWDPVVLPLLATWLLGYFAFNAASLWLKAAPSRRARLLPPLLTYAAATAAFGLLSLALAGWELLGWLACYAPLLLGALALAAGRRERSVLGGALTVAAGSLMTLVCRFPDARDVLAGWGDPAVGRALAVTLVLFGYFFGTVLYVKTLIRERGRPAWRAASVGWHAGCTAVAAAATASGVPAAYAVFFGLAALRAALVPRLAGRHPIAPRHVGLGEVVLSVALLGIIAGT